jgi:tyrosine-specific transport protein
MTDITTNKNLPVWSMSLLVTGNVLGVGVLALPIKTGMSGFYPTVLAVIAIWAMMCFTALIIAKRIRPGADGLTHFDIPSFFQVELGNAFKWIAIVANLIILYGVITAYLSMVAIMISKLIPTGLSVKEILIIYFVLMFLVMTLGRKIVHKGNMVIMLGIWVSFAFLLFYCFKIFNPSNLSYQDWVAVPLGLPVIVSAFHFHNIVPTVCRQLQFDYQSIRKAIVRGTFIGLIINLLWVLVVLGGLHVIGHGPATIAIACAHGEPANVPLAVDLHSHLFVVFSLIFAMLAVTASYMANGTGLMNFIKDLTTSYLKKKHRLLIAVLSFAPPLIITMINPNIFLKALNIVGGVGEVILFAIFPAFVLLRHIYRNRDEAKRKLLPALLTLFISVFIFFVAVVQQFH